jgi:hypothetical protein
MRYFIFFFAVLIFTSPVLLSQTIKGVVLNKQTGAPIKYTTVGIVNKPYGTYCNIDGTYKLKLPNFSETDSIQYSCVGYKPVSFNLNNYLKQYETGSMDTIFLEEKVVKLKEIVVHGGKRKNKIIGNKNANCLFKIGAFGNRETGIIIRNDKHLSLKKVSFKLTMAAYAEPDSAIFRFNIYSLKDGLPHKNILKEPIYFHLKKGQFDRNKVNFDISDHNIQVYRDFAATFEHIKQYGGSRIYFCGKITGCKGIYRKGPQGKWKEKKADSGPLKLKQSLEILVTYEK